MGSMNICHVVGARPNFMKAAPVMAALATLPGVTQALVHTGQHYDENMSRVFFEELGLPVPDVNLEVGSGTHAAQTAQIMVRFEEYLAANRPDLVLVYGDVNSTIAAALVCAKLLIRVGHVEAGLRSFDRTMPEEINRILTDQVADLLFTPSEDGNENLLREGVPPLRMHLVGNVMIDTLVRLLPRAAKRAPTRPGGSAAESAVYCLVTLHRPSNVDDPAVLGRIMDALADISRRIPVVFPVHPRTKALLLRTGDPRFASEDVLSLSRETEAVLGAASASASTPSLRLLPPLGYLNFLALQMRAAVVITDSGGMQEETTYLGIPCLTVRENTERPVTVTMGTNTLVGRDMSRLRTEAYRILDGHGKHGTIPPLWDGRAAHRIAAIIAEMRA